MGYLIVIPTQREADAFVDRWQLAGMRRETRHLGRLQVEQFVQHRVSVSIGGVGKAQFGIQTQHLIDHVANVDAVICVGTSGALASGLVPGDVIVGIETVEHDVRKHGRQPPTFPSDESLLAKFRRIPDRDRDFRVHFGTIASGDEDVMNEQRKREIHASTGALAVAWEGAGGARACSFSGIPYIEVRGISDLASDGAVEEFRANVRRVMENLADLIQDLVSHGDSVNGTAFVIG